MAVQKWQEKFFGMAGVARKVFWHGGSGKKSFFAWREWQKKCFGVEGEAKKFFGVAGVTILPHLAAIKSEL